MNDHDPYADMPPLASADDEEEQDGPYATTGSGGTGSAYPAGGLMVGDVSGRADVPSSLRWKCKFCGLMNPIFVEGCGECNAPHL